MINLHEAEMIEYRLGLSHTDVGEEAVFQEVHRRAGDSGRMRQVGLRPSASEPCLPDRVAQFLQPQAAHLSRLNMLNILPIVLVYRPCFYCI